MPISVEIKGLESILSRIRTLPKMAQDEVMDVAGAYALEEVRREPPQNSVTRYAAYGVTFFSPAQRRWFWWKFGDEIRTTGKLAPYNRTGGLSNAWKISRSENQIFIENDTPGVQFVMGIKQSRHEKMVGWRMIKDIMDKKLNFRNSKFRDMCYQAVKKAILKMNLG